jgi:hypothetical protein
MTHFRSLPAQWRFLIAFVVILPCINTSFAQENVFIPVDEQQTPLSTRQDEILNIIRSRSTSVSVTLVRLGINLKEQPSIVIKLADGIRVVANAEKIIEHTTKDYTWYGLLSGSDVPVFLSVSEDHVTGMIHTDDAVFSIEPIGEGLNALIQLDQSAYPPDEPPGFDEESDAAGKQGFNDRFEKENEMQVSLVQSNPVIDLLIVYTQAAANASGNITSLINGSIDASNMTLSNSIVPASVVKVHQAQVTYTESGNADTDVNRLAGTSDGYMDNVHSLRNQYYADVVVLIVSNLNSCGIAHFINASVRGQHYSPVGSRVFPTRFRA